MKYTGYFDGGCITNPGAMTAGAVLYNGMEILATASKAYGNGTNNEAEWLGLIELLRLAKEAGVKVLLVRGDSRLVINQVRGKWKVRAEHLKPYKQRARRLLAQFDSVTFEWVKRAQNREADYLAGLAKG